MSDKMKVRQGNDGYCYPYTSDDLVVDENGKSNTKKFEEIDSQFKDIANLSLTKHTDGKVYIKKQDGTLLGTGVKIEGGEVPDNIVLFENDGSANDIITAGNIKITDTNNNFTATDVEGALSELFQSASNGKTLIANAITGKGVATNVSDSFETMATNINNIATSGTGITPTGTKEIIENGTYDVTNYASANVNVSSTSSSSILPAVGTFEVTNTIYEAEPAQIEIEHGLGRTPIKVITFPFKSVDTSKKCQLGFYGDSNVNIAFRSDTSGLASESAGISTTSKYIRVDENKIYLSPLPWVNTVKGTYCWVAI